LAPRTRLALRILPEIKFIDIWWPLPDIYR
jgi:hypothetical protein